MSHTVSGGDRLPGHIIRWCILPVLEKKVDDGIAPILVVEEHEQGPVHEPRPLVQLLKEGCEGVGVDDLLQLG